MNNQQEQAAEYLKLFDYDGNEVKATLEDLYSIERMSFDEALHRRVVGERSGRYWLISNRPGLYAMVLEVSIFHCYPREEDVWEISYCTKGIASYPKWSIEDTLRLFSTTHLSVDEKDGKPIPPNVAEIARQQVAFRAGKEPGGDPLDRFGVRTRDIIDVKERLNQYGEGKLVLDNSLSKIVGDRVGIFELMLAITTFCQMNGLGESAMEELLTIIVPEDQHERLVELITMMYEQISD